MPRRPALPEPALPEPALPRAAGGWALRRNIFSIRPVTAYPPTTLAAAKNAAMNAST